MIIMRSIARYDAHKIHVKPPASSERHHVRRLDLLWGMGLLLRLVQSLRNPKTTTMPRHNHDGSDATPRLAGGGA